MRDWRDPVRRLSVLAALLVCLALAVAFAADGPLTNLANLPIRTDANGYILAAAQTYTGPDGPRRVLANTLGRTDANGYLIITNPSGFVTIPLPVSSGGTGLITLAASRIPYGNGTNPFQSAADFTFDGTTLTTHGQIAFPATQAASQVPVVVVVAADEDERGMPRDRRGPTLEGVALLGAAPSLEDVAGHCDGRLDGRRRGHVRYRRHLHHERM